MSLLISKAAVLSVDGVYRLRLDRDLHRARGIHIAGIMVNPSTADDHKDDQTIRKWYGFCDRLNAHRLTIGNLFAFRSKNVRDLRTAEDPVGPHNDRFLGEIMREADIVIVAWGPLSKLPPNLRTRWHAVVKLAESLNNKPLHCFGVAKDGHPLHPLTLSYDRKLSVWQPPRGESL